MSDSTGDGRLAIFANTVEASAASLRPLERDS